MGTRTLTSAYHKSKLVSGSEGFDLKTISTSSIWDPLMNDPSQQRQGKPRNTGLTMVMDKGLGLYAFHDLLQLAAEHIDFIKLGFGTAGVTPPSVIKKKLQLSHQYGIIIYPGGTFFEVAYAQNRLTHYFKTLRKLGFSWVEISDGTISLPTDIRRNVIRQAREEGLQIITEIGKKEAGAMTPIPHLVETFYQDREDGAEFVIIEGRETGENIGAFNARGEADIAYIQEIQRKIPNQYIFWEAPKKNQQVTLIQLAGAKINFGNVPPTEVLSLEALRRGLRSDTFGIGIKDVKQ